MHLKHLLHKKSILSLALIFYVFSAYSLNDRDSTNSKNGRKNVSYLGYIPKKDSASGVSPHRFAKGFNVQLPSLIQGQIPGLNIYSAGEPGKPFEVYNRLFTSFNLSPVTFYVVDNIPIYGDIGFLNLDDIASISFVDGGTAASIYGDRAVNGAIIVTTKSPTSTLRVAYTGSASVSYVPKQVDVYSANEFREVVRTFWPEAAARLGSANTNWQDAIYQNSFGHQHSVALSDSRSGIPIRASIGYTDQQGVVKTTDYRRFTGAIALSPSFFNDDLKVDMGVWFAKEKSTPMQTIYGQNPENPIKNAIFFNPTFPIYEDNKYGGYYGNLETAGANNPVALLNQVDRSNKVRHINESIKATYRLPFLKELSFAAGFANVSTLQDQHNSDDSNAAWTKWRGALSYIQSKDVDYTNWDLSAAYDKDFKWLQSSVQAAVGISRTSFSSTYFDVLNRMGSLKSDNDLTVDTKDKGTFARFSYSLLDRYQVGLNFHNRKYSFFGKDADLNSYTINGSWNIKKESFLLSSTAVSQLSLFASIGKTHDGTEFGFSGLISSDIKPSSVTNFRVGGQVELYSGRVAALVAYQRNKVNDVVTTVLYPSGAYFNNLALINSGSLKSSNLELSVQALLLKIEDFSWRMGLSMSYATNDVDSCITQINGVKVQKTGEPIGAFFMRKQIYDANGKPKAGRYEDLGVIGNSLDDYYAYKKSIPSTLMSLHSQLRYKSWSLDLLGRASWGGYVYNGTASYSYYERLHTWPIANIPKLVERSSFVWPELSSDFYVENGSFFRMEYISLGYTFGGKLRPHLSATVQNAFLISGYSGVDPEVSSGIDEAGRYPRPRIFSVGLELTL
ncbi:TonB-dependent receptor plug domain-containing protein [Alistipes sp. ZOR0009]|uniref:TonB-dependent receptor plug domain-containing protein n=1 Tax=Alistipes sp. ZOR0009 TaxID=1339253 RepID=UPI00064814E4|nr:TonB-dependent receptor plug domain-containing protein [Alistipes sp. ZOR0009]